MSAQRSGTQKADVSGFRFGSGRHVIRSEDLLLVTGQGKFTDDLDMAGQVHAAFVRATVAHAIILKVDVAAAMRMPGVVAVITGSDLATDNIGGIPPVVAFNGRDGKPVPDFCFSRHALGNPRFGSDAGMIVHEQLD